MRGLSRRPLLWRKSSYAGQPLDRARVRADSGLLTSSRPSSYLNSVAAPSRQTGRAASRVVVLCRHVGGGRLGCGLLGIERPASALPSRGTSHPILCADWRPDVKVSALASVLIHDLRRENLA